MNILLISQCHKNALKETRRILDQFAERCGDRTWQTAITKAGLDTLHKLLRQSARKNTAVACYWTHGKNFTELLWRVGDINQFNDQGRVPTNRTTRNILKADDENTWQHATTIQILATLAALLHDLGKATVGFQDKLKPPSSFMADPYRHEWISLQLFTLMLQGCETNDQCLERLANFEEYRTKYPTWFEKLPQNDKDQNKAINLLKLPEVAQIIGWLITSHHRLPFGEYYNDKYETIDIKRARSHPSYTSGYTLDGFYYNLRAFNGWVKNGLSTHNKPKNFWKLQADTTQSKTWQKDLTRWANKALAHQPLTEIAQTLISNPLLFHLTRLSLMVGDHNYSSLHAKEPRRVKGDANHPLIANTNKKDGQPKQTLDEHLIGVAKFTARFARLLPKLPKELPTLTSHKAFTKRTTIKQYNWQNHAFDLSKSLQTSAEQQGFFGVNMASTGCGKTLGNARIMYALANPKQGARFTIALGLRILTLQTSDALKQKLNLTEEHLATLVGGQANQLFELNKEQESILGADSAEELVEGEIPNLSESPINQQELGTIIADSKARHLLYTPLVSCTIDHITSASENKRGGKHIAPILRLLTSDLILDEPDDFSQQDLPALARLVHLAGLFGSKVLLSSATLTPDLITGLFDAYQAGRTIWQQQHSLPNQGIVCAWFDEFNQTSARCENKNDYIATHNEFTEKRVQQLAKAPVRRMAEIMPINLPPKPEGQDIHYGALANQLLHQAHALHLNHHEKHPEHNKTISTGLIRIAHTKQLILLLQAMYQSQELPADTQYHLCCYHARQLLVLRSALEKKLDRLLNRAQPEQLYKQPEIIEAIKNSTAQHHIFIVIATPVAEIGRDHDYNWGIIEPSSMRSIIQLVGRIWRHRPNKTTTIPNVAIMQSNIKALKHGNGLGVGKECFIHPGFEEENSQFLLSTHKLDELLTQQQLNHINAIPRIQKNEVLNPKQSLADLEHHVMQHLFIPKKPNYITAYWQPELAHHACAHLSLLSPFRYQPEREEDYICQLNNDPAKNGGYDFGLLENAMKNLGEIGGDTRNSAVIYTPYNLSNNPTIKPWLSMELEEELTYLAEQSNQENLNKVAFKYATVSLAKETAYHFNPYFGLWKKKA